MRIINKNTVASVAKRTIRDNYGINRIAYYLIEKYNTKTEYVCFSSVRSIKAGFKGKIVELGDNGNMLMSKTSGIPRYRMKGIPYRIVRKYEDADYVVYNPKEMSFSKLCYWNSLDEPNLMFNTEDNGWISADAACLTSLTGKSINELVSSDRTSLEMYARKVLQAHNDYLDSGQLTRTPHVDVRQKITDIYMGEVCVVSEEAAQLLDWVINRGYTNLIKDRQLLEKIDAVCPDVDKSSLNSIIEMLESNDDATHELGWKTLCNMNTTSIRNVVKMLLMIYSKCLKRNVYNSVGMQSMMNGIGYTLPSWYVGKIFGSSEELLRHIGSMKFEDNEKESARMLIEKLLHSVMDWRADDYVKKFSDIGLRMSIRIDFK